MLLARVPARCSEEEVTLPARAAARFGFLFLPSLEVTGTSGRAASDSDLKSSLYSSLFSVLSGKFIRTLNKAWIGFLESIDTIQFLKTNMFSKHRERINNDHSTVKYSLSITMNVRIEHRWIKWVWLWVEWLLYLYLILSCLWNRFLATLVALHFTPVSKSLSKSLSGQSFGLA